MDSLNQLGLELKKTSDVAKKALNKNNIEYGIAESARDIFDSIVPFTMNFSITRKNSSVFANLIFEPPPPIDGTGNCCADCFCSICESYLFSDFINREALTTYPYIASTIKVYDSYGQTYLVTETDPAAGIVNLGYDPIGDSTNIIYICYIYKYNENCTTNIV